MRLRSFILPLLCCPLIQWATVYKIPRTGNIIGKIQVVEVQPGDSLYKIATEYDIPFHKIIAANPEIATKTLKAGMPVTLPMMYILPDIREGIVVNITELRMYYFPPNQNVVYTYPVAMGRAGWRTPTTETYIYKKEENPIWKVPPSIREYHYHKTGEMLPDEVPSGPENPLGYYAMYLKLWGYLIHGNNDPSSIGKYVSSGCIRLFNQDIEQLFKMVEVKTPVYFIHYALKAGWQGNQLYLESNPRVSGYKNQAEDKLFIVNVHTALAPYDKPDVHIDWDKAEAVAKAQEGVPIAIGYRATP